MSERMNVTITGNPQIGVNLQEAQQPQYITLDSSDKKDDLKIDIKSNPPINLQMQRSPTHDIAISPTPHIYSKDYNGLINRPQINDVTLAGNLSTVDLRIVSENSEAGWSETPLYIPKLGEVCVYTDTARIKVGDGVVPIADLPYIGLADTQAVMDALQNHASNRTIHVTQEDRDRWDAKLNYTAVGDTLIFNRL